VINLANFRNMDNLVRIDGEEYLSLTWTAVVNACIDAESLTQLTGYFQWADQVRSDGPRPTGTPAFSLTI